MSITVTGAKRNKDKDSEGWHKGGVAGTHYTVNVSGKALNNLKENVVWLAILQKVIENGWRCLLPRDITTEETSLDPVDADKDTVASWIIC